jgi:hypothetical protein
MTLRIEALLSLVLCAACGSGPEGVGPRDAASDAPRDANEPGTASGDLTVLTYNVAGLPEGISGSHPERNTPQISPRLNDFGLVLVQEDFWYHAVLIKDDQHPYRSEPWRTPPVAEDIGDGLDMFSLWPFADYEHVYWGACNGQSDCASDCLAKKGFTFARLTLAPGQEIDVYNLHMEAGGCAEDVVLREADAKLLSDTILMRSKDRAVIVGGDFNLHEENPTDYAVLTGLLERTGLSDTCRTLQCTRPQIDRVLFRSGQALTLTAKSWQVHDDFVDAASGEQLSDHKPVSAVLTYVY